MSAANVAGMTGEVKATDQQYHMTTARSFCGSAGLLLPADMAHATIITATMSIYAPRANLPTIAPPPLAFGQHSQGRPAAEAIVNFWLMPPSH
jgi:hypothetical protein